MPDSSRIAPLRCTAGLLDPSIHAQTDGAETPRIRASHAWLFPLLRSQEESSDLP